MSDLMDLNQPPADKTEQGGSVLDKLKVGSSSILAKTISRPGVVLVLVLPFIALSWFLSMTMNMDSNEAIRLMLDTVTMAMIISFVLIFMLTLLASVVSSRYSPRIIDIVFSEWTIAYMFLFIGSILVTIFNINSNDEMPLRISLGLTTTCILLLPPFMIWIKTILRPKHFIESQSRRALRRYSVGAVEKDIFPAEVRIIANIMSSSYGFRDYDTFEIGLRELARMVKTIPDRRVCSEIMAMVNQMAISNISHLHNTRFVVDFIYDIAADSLEKEKLAILENAMDNLEEFLGKGMEGKMSATIFESTKALGRIGRLAVISENTDMVLAKIIDILGAIGQYAVEDGYLNVQEAVCEIFETFAGKIYKNRDRFPMLITIVNHLDTMGAIALEKKDEPRRKQIAMALGNIGKITASNSQLSDLTKRIISSWEKLFQGLQI